MPFPPTGRLAAIDFGTVRIGVAVCDADRVLASPYEVYQVSNPDRDAQYFRDLAQQERLAGFIVGLPIHCDGGESQKSRECREFAGWLADQTGLPIRMFDERFSTAAAKDRLAGPRQRNQKATRLTRQKQKKKLDAVAALVLLETYLEASRYHGHDVGQAIDAAPDGADSLE